MYYGAFTNENDVCVEFQIPKVNGTILFAAYDTPDYEGYAAVILLNEGKLLYVEGGHCSCFGLEGQWEPSETPVAVLRHMTEKGYGILSTYREPVAIVLDEVERAGIVTA